VVFSIVFFSVDPQVELWRPKDMYDEKVCARNQGLGCALARMKRGNRIDVITRCCFALGFDLTRCFFEITRCFLEITRCCLSWRKSDKIFAFSDKIFVADDLQMIIVIKAHARDDI